MTDAEIKEGLALCQERLIELANPSHYSQGLTDIEWSRQHNKWTDRKNELLRLASATKKADPHDRT